MRIFIIHLNSKRSRTLFKIGVKTLIRGCTTSDLGLHFLSALCPLQKEIGLNELIILCNITFYVNTLFFIIILDCQNLLSDFIQRRSLYRDRKDGATKTANTEAQDAK